MSAAPFPFRVILELTPQCNLACPMCPRHYISESDGFMKAGLFRKLVDEIAEENPTAVVLPFWRGESCLHPDFVPLLEYALDKGLRIHLSTNGHFMDTPFREVFYRCEFLTFSIHSERGYRNARKLIEEKPEWSDTTVQISFVDTEKSTAKHLDECSGDPNLMGFDSVRLYVEHTRDGEFGKGVSTRESERHYCPKLEDTFAVSSDGGYSRCNHIWLPESPSALEVNTIKDVWNGKRMQEIRGGYPDEQCAPCDQWTGHTQGKAWRRGQNGEVEHIVYGL